MLSRPTHNAHHDVGPILRPAVWPLQDCWPGLCAGQCTSCLMWPDPCAQAFPGPGIRTWRRQRWALQRSSSLRSARPRPGTSARQPAPSCGTPASRCSRTCTEGRGTLLWVTLQRWHAFAARASWPTHLSTAASELRHACFEVLKDMY